MTDHITDTNDPTHDLIPTVVELTAQVEGLTQHVITLDATVAELVPQTKTAAQAPAEWAWFPPPESTERPPATLALWVEFYNATYVTTTSSSGDDHNRAIPGCWLHHPGLAAEIATLAASWRASFVGPGADPVGAQNWHDRWRPGFAERLRAWAPCSSDQHLVDLRLPRPRASLHRQCAWSSLMRLGQ